MAKGQHDSKRGPQPKGERARTEELKIKMEPGHRALLHEKIKKAGWKSTTDCLHALAGGGVTIEPSQTDLERFVSLYRSFGIDCVVTKSERLGLQSIVLAVSSYESKGVTLHDELIGGYANFKTRVVFDGDGRFVRQDIYED